MFAQQSYTDVNVSNIQLGFCKLHPVEKEINVVSRGRFSTASRPSSYIQFRKTEREFFLPGSRISLLSIWPEERVLKSFLWMFTIQRSRIFRSGLSSRRMICFGPKYLIYADKVYICMIRFFPTKCRMFFLG